jgi:hypothetical protein
MKFYITGALLSLAIITQAQALTFKTGEVLGPDGQVYHGASPDQMDRLIDKAKESGDAGGITGNTVFVVVGDEVTFIPINDLRGLPKDSQIAVIGNAVVQDLTGSDDVTYEQVSAVTELSEETGVSVEALLNDGDLASMDPTILKQVEAMPDDQVNQFIEDLGNLVDSGMAEQVDAFLTELREIEGAMDAITNFDSYDSCVAGGGGDVCDRIQEAQDRRNL